MADAALKTPAPQKTRQDLTERLSTSMIDALKLNGLTTIYGVPGIPSPISAAWRRPRAFRVLSFRHEQNAGYRRGHCRLPDQEARHLPHRVGTRFPERPDGTRSATTTASR